MANEEHLALIKQGVDTWNRARMEELWDTVPDLQEANLSGWDLAEFDLSETNLTYANLSSTILQGANISQAMLLGAQCISANLRDADLQGADLRGADLREARLDGAILRNADLSNADLGGANLSEAELGGAILVEADMRLTNCYKAKLRKANLCEANLSGALLIRTEFQNAILTGCRIYGASVWDLQLEGAEQSNIVISPFTATSPDITVDNLEVAQFVYLLLNNEKIREVIDTITSKAVLILGRFTPERKAVLDAIREELRHYDCLPIMFDFQNPKGGLPVEGRNYIETVSTLAHMARFIIADLTDAKVVLQELERIVPGLPSVPVQPIVQAHTNITDVIIDFVGRPNFLELYVYRDIAEVKANLYSKIIRPAEAQLTEIHTKRLQFLEQVRQITNR